MENESAFTSSRVSPLRTACHCTAAPRALCAPRALRAPRLSTPAASVARPPTPQPRLWCRRLRRRRQQGRRPRRRSFPRPSPSLGAPACLCSGGLAWMSSALPSPAEDLDAAAGGEQDAPDGDAPAPASQVRPCCAFSRAFALSPAVVNAAALTCARRLAAAAAADGAGHRRGPVRALRRPRAVPSPHRASLPQTDSAQPALPQAPRLKAQFLTRVPCCCPTRSKLRWLRA